MASLLLCIRPHSLVIFDCPLTADHWLRSFPFNHDFSMAQNTFEKHSTSHRGCLDTAFVDENKEEEKKWLRLFLVFVYRNRSFRRGGGEECPLNDQSPLPFLLFILLLLQLQIVNFTPYGPRFWKFQSIFSTSNTID